MPSSTLLPIVAFLLGAGAVGGILVAAFYPRLAGSSPFDRRLQAISALRGVTTRLRQADVGWSRRRYHFTCAGVAAVLFLAILGMLGLLPAAGFGLAGGL